MMKCFILLVSLFIFSVTKSQTGITQPSDSSMIGPDSVVAEAVTATFKSTRIVNSQSIETLGRHVLDFRIMHRFGMLNTGLYQMFGLDNASMRMGFEYGITKRFMIGLGRTTLGKTYDGFVKCKIIKQTTGGIRNMPFTLTFFASTTYKTFRYNTPRDNYFDGKLDYVSQLLIARKFNRNFSLQLMPTYVHRNLVETPDQNNNLIAIGIGGRYKVLKRVSVNFDYFYTPQNQLGKIYSNPLSIGVDIETGGHVFQLHFTNSLGMVEKQFIGETTGTWRNGDVAFGFNLSRVF
jgi:hypothetical protein